MSGQYEPVRYAPVGEYPKYGMKSSAKLCSTSFKNLRKIPKNPEVTRCYTGSDGLTLFVSTSIRRAHKLLLKGLRPVIGASNGNSEHDRMTNVDRAKRIIGQWMAGAAATLLLASLAFAHPPHGGAGGGHGFGGGHRAFVEQGARGRPPMGVSSGGPRWGLQPMSMPSYGRPGGNAEREVGRDASRDFGRYGGNGGYGGMNPYRSISANPGSMQRGGEDGAMRSGSIRADVARYNEERGGRPPPQPRTQEASSSRNNFFSSFYRNN